MLRQRFVNTVRMRLGNALALTGLFFLPHTAIAQQITVQPVFPTNTGVCASNGTGLLYLGGGGGNVGDCDASAGGIQQLDFTGGADINMSGSGTNLNVNSGASIEVDNGGSLNIGNNGVFTVQSGGQFFIEPGADIVSMGSNRVQFVGDPVDPTDAANKRYVDQRINTVNTQVDENTKGVAMAMAMGGGADLRNGESMAVSFDWGTYDGENAGAVSGIAALGSQGGVNVYGKGSFGFSGGDNYGGRAGIEFGW
jgi:hypothetical protein